MDSSTQQKVDRRIIKTRKAIHQAFHDLLAKNDLSKITVSAIARKADIDRKTFYLHFSSIEELISQEAQAIVERVTKVLASPPSIASHQPGATLGPDMRHVLMELEALATQDVELYQHVFFSLTIDQMVDQLIEPVRRAVVANGGFQGTDEATLDYLVRFYIAGTLSVFTHWFTNDRNHPIESVVDVVERATQRAEAQLAHP